jgi:hypothetical protein
MHTQGTDILQLAAHSNLLQMPLARQLEPLAAHRALRCMQARAPNRLPAGPQAGLLERYVLACSESAPHRSLLGAWRSLKALLAQLLLWLT